MNGLSHVSSAKFQEIPKHVVSKKIDKIERFIKDHFDIIETNIEATTLDDLLSQISVIIMGEYHGDGDFEKKMPQSLTDPKFDTLLEICLWFLKESSLKMQKAMVSLGRKQKFKGIKNRIREFEEKKQRLDRVQEETKRRFGKEFVTKHGDPIATAFKNSKTFDKYEEFLSSISKKGKDKNFEKRLKVLAQALQLQKSSFINDVKVTLSKK